MTQAKAQDEVIKLAENVGFVNTGEPAFCRSFLTYHQPEVVEMPFASKGMEAVLKAVAANKATPPVMEEITNTTLLVPHPSKGWEGVHETFVPRLLGKDVGLEMFGDPCLSPLSKTLLEQEFECRARLSDTLHMQTMLESAMVEAVNEGDMAGPYRFMSMAKLHLRMFVRDLHAFVMKRKECRVHVLSKAMIRHEPERLIQASPWGRHLFPQEIVDEIKTSLMRDNMSLAVRWKIASYPPRPVGQHQQQQYQKRRQAYGHGVGHVAAKKAKAAIPAPPPLAPAATGVVAATMQPSVSTGQPPRTFVPYSSAMLFTQTTDPQTGQTSFTPVSSAAVASTSGAAFAGSPLAQSPYNKPFRGKGYGAGKKGRGGSRGGRGGGKGRGKKGGNRGGFQ